MPRQLISDVDLIGGPGIGCLRGGKGNRSTDRLWATALSWSSLLLIERTTGVFIIAEGEGNARGHSASKKGLRKFL